MINADLLTRNILDHGLGVRAQVREIITTTITTGMPITTKRQPSLVMQLMMVKGSRISFNARRSGRVTRPNNWNTI